MLELNKTYTPERQSIYSSIDWKLAVKEVWKRDKGFCKKCGKKNTGKMQYDIHHLESFSNKELRCEPNNLILLCHKCHLWVHSKENITKEFIHG